MHRTAKSIAAVDAVDAQTAQASTDRVRPDDLALGIEVAAVE